MRKETTNLKIENYIEIRKSLWTAIIVISSGLAGLLLSMGNLTQDITSLIKVILLVSGSFLDIFLINSVASTNTEILKLINDLE